MTDAGKVAVITGTTHGIGRVTARALARAGYRVLMLCRNAVLATDVAAGISRETPGARVEVVPCDLAVQASVRTAAQQVLEQSAGIDLLINNAGIVSSRHRMSVDGYELTFATNHLGPFLLTQLLLPRVHDGGRIIHVASRVHFDGHLDLTDIRNPAARYRPIAAYARSKLANVMHCFALARRLQGRPITANCLHPGVVASNLLPKWLQIVKPWITPVTLDNERGAQTTLYLALSPDVAGRSGLYFDEHQAVQPAAAAARDLAAQERLWEASERYTSAAGSGP